MPSFEDSKKIINDEFEISEDQFCRISFDFKRQDGNPLSLEEIRIVSDNLIRVLEKHNMDWKLS